MFSILASKRFLCDMFAKSICRTTSWSSCIISSCSCIIFSNLWAYKDCDTTTSNTIKLACSKSFFTFWMFLVVLYLDTRFKSSCCLMHLFTSISTLVNMRSWLTNHTFIALQLFVQAFPWLLCKTWCTTWSTMGCNSSRRAWRTLQYLLQLMAVFVACMTYFSNSEAIVPTMEKAMDCTIMKFYVHNNFYYIYIYCAHIPFQ